MAFCLLLPMVPPDVVASPLLRVSLTPVVGVGHPLATLGRAATRDDLESHVQLVLSDPVDRDANNYGLASATRWRFVDLGRRLDFLLAGLGWCRMPSHLIVEHLIAGNLVQIDLAEDAHDPADDLTIYAARMMNKEPGPAGRWLLNDLQFRLSL